MAIYGSADDLLRQFPWPIRSTADARRTIEDVLVCDDRARHLAIVVGARPVGSVAVSHLEPLHDTGWVSYLSSGTVRGRGLVGRSVTALASWALTDLGVFRLELGHRVDNPASGAVALTAGFTPEGVERQKLRHGGRRYDVCTYARLATDPSPRVVDVQIEGR